MQWRGAAGDELLAASEDGICKRWSVDEAGAAAAGPALRQLQAVEVQREVCREVGTRGNGWRVTRLVCCWHPLTM